MFRPAVALLLCSLSLLGHIPGWIHRNQCDHSHCCVAKLPTNSSSGWLQSVVAEHSTCATSDNHCCCHHDTPKSDRGTEHSSDGLTNGTGTTTPHDHESCAVCQSLFAPTGFAPPVLECGCTPLFVASCGLLDQTAILDSRFFLPPSRGPPTKA